MSNKSFNQSLELHCNTSTEAWEVINETFIRGDHCKAVYKGHSQYIYDCVLFIRQPQMDPAIDVFRYFHYSISKWAQLVGNYLNLSELSELKSAIPSTGEFTQVYSFTNVHKNGKGCLLNMICSRRADKRNVLTFFLRASEITKRLLMDLVFFQRIGEYLFDNQPFELSIHFNYLFQDDAVSLMYYVHNPDIFTQLQKAINKGTRDKFHINRYKYLLETLDKLKKCKKLEDIKYKIYRRILKVVNPKIDTVPPKPLMVKNLVLEKYLNV